MTSKGMLEPIHQVKVVLYMIIVNQQKIQYLTVSHISVSLGVDIIKIFRIPASIRVDNG